MEALRYLHTEAECFHNDIKADNILLSSTSVQPISSSKAELPDFPYQIALIDFGNGTMKKPSYLRLAESESLCTNDGASTFLMKLLMASHHFQARVICTQ